MLFWAEDMDSIPFSITLPYYDPPIKKGTLADSGLYCDDHGALCVYCRYVPTVLGASSLARGCLMLVQLLSLLISALAMWMWLGAWIAREQHAAVPQAKNLRKTFKNSDSFAKSYCASKCRFSSCF
jgi:hypothetical protein